MEESLEDDMTHISRSARRETARKRADVLAIGLLLALLPARGVAQPAPVVYEYVYPYNTLELIENHVIVLDTSGIEPRGWYYGTSDEFDLAREGYLPGFFVAPMSNLALSATTIAFTLDRPGRFFTAPVPLEYRDASAIPAGVLEEWRVPLPTPSRSYEGEVSGDRIALDDVAGGSRVFHRR